MAIEHGKHIPEESYDPSKVHPADMYAPATHAENLDLVKDYLVEFGETVDSGGIATPWMLAGNGIARVLGHDDKFVAEIAHNMSNNSPEIGIAEHYVKHHIVLDNEAFIGKKSATRYYLPWSQRIGITLFNTPVSAGMFMGVPNVWHNSFLSSRLLHDYLHNPSSHAIARKEDLDGALAHRPIHRRGWGQIQLGEVTS
jgi:hypothetical protein